MKLTELEGVLSRLKKAPARTLSLLLFLLVIAVAITYTTNFVKTKAQQHAGSGARDESALSHDGPRRFDAFSVHVMPLETGTAWVGGLLRGHHSGKDEDIAFFDFPSEEGPGYWKAGSQRIDEEVVYPEMAIPVKACFSLELKLGATNNYSEASMHYQDVGEPYARRFEVALVGRTDDGGQHTLLGPEVVVADGPAGTFTVSPELCRTLALN